MATLALAAAARFAGTGLAGERLKSIRTAVTGGMNWLSAQQRGDGSVPVLADMDAPAWTTALAVLAWHAGQDAAASFHPQIESAAAWLLNARGETLDGHDPARHHDYRIVGWPWVEGTHSWLEPTAYALLALRAAGQPQHPRAREGVRLILDRAIDTGGWNYGNSRMLGNTIRPFPETTGVALAALASEPRSAAVDNAIAFLCRELPRIRTPLALGWGLIGLQAWSAAPQAAPQWLNEAGQAHLAKPNALHNALLLLAAMPTAFVGGVQ